MGFVLLIFYASEYTALQGWLVSWYPHFPYCCGGVTIVIIDNIPSWMSNAYPLLQTHLDRQKRANLIPTSRPTRANLHSSSRARIVLPHRFLLPTAA